MVLFKKTFEEQNLDTIAVIYELLPDLKRKAVLPTGETIRRYNLDDSKKYLIICGRSEFTFGKGNKIEKIYPTI